MNQNELHAYRAALYLMLAVIFVAITLFLLLLF